MKKLLSNAAVAVSDFFGPEKRVLDSKVVEKIHNEFDTASDRLLMEAEQLIASANDIPAKEFENKAKRLSNLGFISSRIVKEAESLQLERTSNEHKTDKLRKQAELIRYYKMQYPFHKFLTIEELDRICVKYKLVHAPIGSFIGDVPDKNLLEIERAQPYKSGDYPTNGYSFVIDRFHAECPERIKAFYRKHIKENKKFEYANYSVSQSETYVRHSFVDAGYKGDFPGYIFSQMTVSEEVRLGLFICAPARDFDLDKLQKQGVAYFQVLTNKVYDPIVYRYCRGGIQVLSKWGLEASDSALLNEIDN